MHCIQPLKAKEVIQHQSLAMQKPDYA